MKKRMISLLLALVMLLSLLPTMAGALNFYDFQIDVTSMTPDSLAAGEEVTIEFTITNEVSDLVGHTVTVLLDSDAVPGGQITVAASDIVGSKIQKTMKVTIPEETAPGIHSLMVDIDAFNDGTDLFTGASDGGDITVTEESAPHTHDYTDGLCSCGDHNGEHTNWTNWGDDASEWTSLPDSAGNYYLTHDVTLSATWVLNASVNLCLNGHVIKRPSDAGSKYHVIGVSNGVNEAALNLYDCNGEGLTHYFTYNSDAAWTLFDGTPETSVTLDKFDMATAESGKTVVAVTGGCITGGVATSGAATTGGGVYVRSKGTFKLYGGSIIGNDASGGTGGWKGGGVRNAGTFAMYGGSIVGNYAYTGGGVGIDANKKVTMNGGTIAYNGTKSGSGGGVSGDSGSITTFTMKSGAISGNAGGVNGGNFIMKGGAIADNKVTSGTDAGGFIGVNFTMYGGEIRNNTGGRYGGVRSSGDFIMENGSIIENIATDAVANGSGVSTKNFTMYGGEIRNNDATTQYADEFTYGTIYGVGVSVSGVAILGGTARITGNTAGEEGMKFAKDFLGTITFGTGTDTEAGKNGVPVPENGMFVGIRGKNGAFTDENEAYAAYAKYFFADKDDQYVSYDTESHKIGLYTIPAENYLISVVSTTKGSVAATVNSAAAPYAEENAEVTLTVTPDPGCNCVSLTVKDTDNQDVPLSGTGNTRTFTMPGKAVTVTAAFEKPAISYISRSWNETDQTVEEETLQNDEYTVVTDGLREFTSGWYAVVENVTINADVSIPDGETVNLILCDGKTMTVNGAVGYLKAYDKPQSGALTVYGQEKGTGGLTVTKSGTAYEQAIEVYEFTVHGGTLNLTGNTSSTTSGCSGASAHNMTVYAGKINAAGTNAKGQSFGLRIENYGDLKIYGGDVVVNSVGNTWNPYQYTWGVYDGKVYLYGGSLKVDAKSTYVTTEQNPDRLPYAIGGPFNCLRIYGGQLTTSGVTKALNIQKLQWGNYGIMFNDTEVKAGMGSLPEGFTVLTSANQDGTGAAEWDKQKELRDGDYKYVQVTVDNRPKFNPCNGTDSIRNDTAPADPEWGSYTFAGWYTKRVGGVKLTGEPETGKTYYAHWTKNSKYVLTEKLTVKDDGLYIGETKLSVEEAALYGMVFTAAVAQPAAPATLTITDMTIESPDYIGFENTVDDLVIEVKGTNYITTNGFNHLDLGYGNEQWKNYALLTDSHAIKLIGGGELTAKGGNATNQSISTEASYPQYISYGVNGPWQDGKVITIDMEASGKFNAIGGDITTNIGAVSNGFTSDLKMLKGTLTAKGGNVTAGEGESRRSSGLYCESKPTILGGKIAASAGSVSPASDNNRSAMEFHSGISAETLEAANITGTTVPESPNPVSYCKLTQSGADPVVISFGPSISVSKVKVSEQDVASPVYGTAQSARDFFKVETENFEGTPTLKLQWKSGDTWSESAPTGITASFVGGVISIGTTDTLNAGEYEFRITNGEDEYIDIPAPGTPNPDFVSCEAKLKVEKSTSLPQNTPAGCSVNAVQNSSVTLSELGIALSDAVIQSIAPKGTQTAYVVSTTPGVSPDKKSLSWTNVAQPSLTNNDVYTITVESANYVFAFDVTLTAKTTVTFPDSYAFGGGDLVYGNSYDVTPPAITAGGQTVTPMLTYSYEKKTGENTWTPIANKPTDAGTYRVTVTVSSEDGTYTGSSKPYEFTIAKAKQTAPAENVGFTIDFSAETLTASSAIYEVSSSEQTVTSLEKDKVIPGTFVYVRLKGDDNHEPSPWTTISVPARPGAVSGVSAHQESLVDKDDASIRGITDTMEYRSSTDGGATFGSWIYRNNADTSPIGFVFDVTPPIDSYTVEVRSKATSTSFAGEVTSFTLTPNETDYITVSLGGETQKLGFGSKVKEPAEPTKTGYVFGGWYADEDLTQAWNFEADTVSENMTLYPKWIKEDEKYVPISGTVEENSQPVPGAIVELLLGQEKVAATVTDQNGSYSFDNVENGSYNLVVTKNPGKDDEKTRTALVTVSPEQGSTQNVSLPISDVNSILSCDAFPDRKAKTDITKAVVGGLDEIAGERAVNEHKVTVELTVDSSLAPEGEEEIRELADGKSVEFFDLQLKSRLDDGIAADIGKVNDKLLTIVLPFNFSKVVKDSVSVFRYHDNTPETFGKITDSANAEDSKYMVDEENGTITLFAKKFSTYAIAFEEEKTYPTGGGGGSEKSVVSVEDAKNGSISVDKKNAAEGDTVTITVTPDEGFTLETLTVLDQNGKKIELKSLGSNRYSFEMPDGKVTISATFMEDNTMLNFFTDVKADDYFYDAVLWAAENGITQGTDSVHFSPDMGTTRAQVVTFLWRAAGSPEPTGNAAKFTDVLSGSYYEKAVAWAIEQGITKGMTNTTFSPDAVCTRGQIVTFLARFAGVEDADTESAFSDVKTTDYFAAAVKWAKDNKVTEGITKDLFGPYQPCTRAQIVTFLYRWMVR